ncbi:uncharacterized protein [Dysidea avara]|uniref:uncharacterized protein isoform X2 n=1 Tax=Dysidea avara TaxID=196820 RepID=UPI00332DC71F
MENKFVAVLLQFIFMTFCIIGCSISSSSTSVSVVVDSTCNDVPSPGPFEVCSSSAVLTCCVEGCDEWVGHWYIHTDSGKNKFIGIGAHLNATLTSSWQTFLCAITSLNLDCYDDGSVTLKKSVPVLYLVNDTGGGSVVVSEGSRVVICFKVLTVYYLSDEPNITFNATAALRWHRIYYADHDGKFGGVLQNISSVNHFYICLETLYRYHHVYDDGTYAVKVHNECGSTMLAVDLRGICNDSIPVKIMTKLQAAKYAIVGEDVTLSVKYYGIDINSFWKVNYTSYISSSHYTDKFCHTIEDVTLFNVQYSGNYTVTAGRLGYQEPEVSSTVELRVCIKPVLLKAYQPQADEAVLVWIFSASNFDQLVTFQCNKSDEPIHSSGRYHFFHNITENMVYFVLKISNPTNSDIGNYSAQLIYNEAFISNRKSEIGYVCLKLQSTQSSQTEINWKLIWIPIGGLVLIFAFLIIATVLGKRCKESHQDTNHPTDIRTEATALVQQEDQPLLGTSELLVPAPPTRVHEFQPPTLDQPLQLRRHDSPGRMTSKVEQRLTYYRKDIVELLAERDKSEVAAEFKKRDLLHRNELLHFMQIDDRVQSYNYLFDAILVHGAIEAEKFYRYLIDADETEYFFNLVAPKVFFFYVLTTNQFPDNIRDFADLLTKCGINVIGDFYDAGVQNKANLHLWTQEKISTCVNSGGFVLVDVSSGPMNNLSSAHSVPLQMRYAQFDGVSLYQSVIQSRESFIPVCLDNHMPDRVFPFDKATVYNIYISEFMQKFAEFKEAHVLDQYKVGDNDPEAIQVFLNKSSVRFQPIVDLISLLTSQQLVPRN